MAEERRRAAVGGEWGELPGPFEVGRYAREFRGRLRRMARVNLIGEVTGLTVRAKGVYFELRDADGAIPCAMWRDVYDGLDAPEAVLRDGAEIVVSGGPDYYPGSGTASPSFSFRATDARPAGEGDLLAQLERLRNRLAADGMFDPQKRLEVPALPHAIGVVTGRESAARADVLAGLARRSWAGTVLFAHPPVQDRHAAPRITRALQDLAAREEVEAIIVARGGGSLADLWAFCDETLCRTVALLRVPVIAAVGHETDRTLIDDVAAISCSTPTHAAEAAVATDVARARRELIAGAGVLHRAGGAAIRDRSTRLRTVARSLAHHLSGQRRRLHQMLRELRASFRRGLDHRGRDSRRFGLVLARKSEATGVEVAGMRSAARRASRTLARHGEHAARTRRASLDRLASTLEAHDPDRVLERGYALVEDRAGEPITRAEAARRAGRVGIRFADDTVAADVAADEESD